MKAAQKIKQKLINRILKRKGTKLKLMAEKEAKARATAIIERRGEKGGRG